MKFKCYLEVQVHGAKQARARVSEINIQIAGHVHCPFKKYTCHTETEMQRFITDKQCQCDKLLC